ncbi:MAG: beta-propeller fold lactonase family protein, partial [Chloroflexota bacterium]
GRFVYGSNRGHDSIAIFAFDEEEGRLTALGHESTQGQTPRDFALDPSGRYLFVANQDTDTVVTFLVDQQTGQLQSTGQVIQVPSPVCIALCQIP